ncbi:uncharacterized protein L201_004274 [Kwoniella dendrophila CBS 6074]|uniref:Transcription factor IIIC 90kDa subunit N-terminal domain-containing protein n=1 Tax=Kwoniella dendrophila CBS 6074 TaxID=1295534 RepID=A0AAX4JXH2_9TREE
MTIDPYDNPPTILATRIFPGILPSTSQHNVSWNEDGQCLFITKKGVNILTPHLTTTFSPPPTLVDPTLQLKDNNNNSSNVRNQAGNSFVVEDGASDDDEVDLDGGLDEPLISGLDNTTTNNNNNSSKVKSKIRMKRPKNGEIKFWNTGIELDKEGKRNDHYGWNEYNDEIDTVLIEKDVTTRQAIWSPSGLTDLGGSLLVGLSSAMQVSVYAPRNDPYTKQWDEIADLTSIMKGLIPPKEGPLSLKESLGLRTMSIQWSSHLPLPSMIGIDGSLLALSNRAGKITFWSYGLDKRFHQLRSSDVCQIGGWVSDMAWSEWKVLDDESCEAHLALTLTDGSIRVITVIRKIELKSSGRREWALDIHPSFMIDRGDKRTITSIKWIEDVLIWTKPGTVHIFAGEGNRTVQWNGILSLRLERVGNWASANALGPCIGINRINRDTLVIVLSSLTTHIIENFTTSPQLAHPHTSLRNALALRDIFEDHLHSDPLIKIRFRSIEMQPEGWTANTSGWTSLGWGGAGTWVTEPMSFHTLDNATEGKRSMTFVIGNPGKARLSPDESVIEALKGILSDSPKLLYCSPGRILMPYLLHILSLRGPEFMMDELFGLLSSVLDGSQDDLSKKKEQGNENLIEEFWVDATLDRLRLAYVLASWCETTYPSSAEKFRPITNALSILISSQLLAKLMTWVITYLSSGGIGNSDRQFSSQVIKSANQLSDEKSKSHSLSQLAAELDSKLSKDGMANNAEHQNWEERCPACHNEVGSEGICSKGHVWSRCSITHLLVTHPHYRVCSTCPAISLLPKKHLSVPIVVDDQGKDHDYRRFQVNPEHSEENEDKLIQVALESAVCCLNCGGRWQRAV